MKKFIASVLAVLGMSANAEQNIEKVDLNSILYSMPTISGDEIEYQVPTKESFEGAPQFHEDDWCQLEFFSKSRLNEIQRKLTEYSLFESKARTGAGWKEIYVRNIARDAFSLDIKKLESLKGASVQPAPILTTASQPLGQVKNGFSISLGKGALLYGIEKGGKIISLAASVYSDEGNQALTRSFMALDNLEKLMLVDWRAQMVIMGGSDGQLSVWKPK